MNVLHKVTRQNLLKNRTRTIVTIIGVILSVAMMTAVTTMISTMQNYLVESVKAESGDWTLMAFGASDKLIGQLQQDERVERLAKMQSLGYATVEGSKSEEKFYWHVTAWDDTMLKTLPVHITEGRMAQNDREIVVPENMAAVSGVAYKPGDKVTLSLGYREWNGQRLNQCVGYYGKKAPDEDGNPTQSAPEHLVPVATRTFTVVGVCERMPFAVEESSSPGYTAITRPGAQDQVLSTDVYLCNRHPKDAPEMYTALKEQDNETGSLMFQCNIHSDLLRVMGVIDNENIVATLGAMGAILLIIILVGSVSLIYNAFAISVSERSKQFGLLSSVGATRKQLRSSVLYEALVIGGIGIPLGLLAGVGGIGVTLYFIGDWFRDMVISGGGLSMHLSVSWLAIVVAAALGMVTILLSAWIPAKRASRVTAIEAIRQSQDIQIRAKQVKTSRLTRKLFGFGGELALKNLKRSRRRYRSTVLSLVVSMVLFISASAFTMYATGGSEQVLDVANYDVAYVSYPSENTDYFTDRLDTAFVNRLYHELKETDGVAESALVERVYLETLISKDDANNSYYQRKQQLQEQFEEATGVTGEDAEAYLTPQGEVKQHTMLYAMDSTSFARFAREAGVSLPADDKGLTAIAIRNSYEYDSDENRYQSLAFFKDNSARTVSLRPMGQSVKTGLPVKIAGFTDTLPMGMQFIQTSDELMLILPDTQMSAVREWAKTAGKDTPIISRVQMYFRAEDSAKVTATMKTVLEEQKQPTNGLVDIHETDNYTQRLYAILKVFTYGFITLISLITVANVFNTMSTNIRLRRREFAMLQSVGMSPREFSRMMRFECLFYGLKALLFGLPISFLLMYAMYRSMIASVDIRFLVPWSSVIISIAGVFVVVFVTMLYATHRIRKENIIDALKTETT